MPASTANPFVSLGMQNRIFVADRKTDTSSRNTGYNLRIGDSSVISGSVTLTSQIWQTEIFEVRSVGLD